MDTYGLVGYPLGHSFSATYFAKKFKTENINAQYLNFELTEIGKLSEMLSAHPCLRGFNVTIPYKKAIIPYLDHIDLAAAAIGAVNVVKVNPDGTLTGFNSDVYGFVESIRPLLDPTVHTRALVLGTGGASLAVMAGLASLGIEVTRVSRAATGHGILNYSDLTPAVMAQHTVIVNTTPLGMYPNIDSCPDIPYQDITQHHVCYDVVYNPLQTEFMRRAALQGATVSNGLAMLHLQADKAWQLWTE